MVWHGDYVDRPELPVAYELSLGCGLDVARDEQPMPPGLDAQDAGSIVALEFAVDRWMQDMKVDAIPAPPLACFTAAMRPVAVAWRFTHKQLADRYVA